MKKAEEDNLLNARLKESYQGDPLERAYQPKAQTSETPEPPPVGSTTVIPVTNTDNTSQGGPQEDE